jgi:hypothetical protein
VQVDLTESTIDDLTYRALESVRAVVETGGATLSSENTFRFLFAWELGRLLEYTPQYRVDFDALVFTEADTEDRFLDLLVWTDPQPVERADPILLKRAQRCAAILLV